MFLLRRNREVVAMDSKHWSVIIISPNRILAKLQVDLFREAGAREIYVAHSAKDALKLAGDKAVNVIVADLSDDIDGSLQLVKSIRGFEKSPTKKAFVFGVSNTMTASLVQQLRMAGVNAAIGLPLSKASLIHTVQRVLAKPRPFIEVETYTGPCRRAGIISVNAVENRRRVADAEITQSRSDAAKSA